MNVGGNTYKGNVFSGSTSITGGSADAKNNVESVFLPAGLSGGFTVTVTAASINSVGVPNASNALSQDFALVVYNAGPSASLIATGYTLTTNEPCTNGAVNPGETVTVNLALQNVGDTFTTNLVATLLAGNGIAFPSGPQTYGAMPAGASATNAFSFFADGTCGQTITAVLQLQDGPANLGTVSNSFLLGLPVSTTYYTQNFDGVTTPALPSGWITDASGGLKSWTTENSTNDGATNVAYCPDAATPGEVYLYSPTNAILLKEGANQLSFRNEFNLEETYDGGVLEIAIGNNAIAISAFTDILTAGGSFVAGGYTDTITDSGDPTSQQNPLINRQAWTGNSGGVVTTIINLPAAASGTNIQLRWICGTDKGNYNLVGTGGWWIDDIAVSQPSFDCSNCPATNVSVPTIAFPTNGYQFTTISPMVVVTGQATNDYSTLTISISNNIISNMTVTADGNGVYAAPAMLNFGSNTLTATQGATNSSSNVVIYIALGPPILDVPTVANPQVAVSGAGAAGATVYLYEGDAAAGTPLTNLVVDASGNFSGSITLPLGNSTLTATEAISGQISANTAPVSVSVVPMPPPTIVSPANGLVTNKVSLSISGTGLPGAAVTIYDVTSNGTNQNTTTVNRGGKFSAVMGLADGMNTFFAAQEQNGANSPASAPVVVTDYLAPEILVQPANQTNFLKGSVTFSAQVAGAAPLKMFWRKNGVNIPGAVGSTLTLSNLKTSETANSYSLTASNKYGEAYSSVATVTLVPNPFTNLSGAYYGLFAESNAQFESSGLLTLHLTTLGKFTARILSAGGGYSFSGGLSGVGWWSNNVSRGPGKTPLTVLLDLDVTNGMEQILGAVSAGTNWNAALEADRATYSAANKFTNGSKFTLIFGGANNGAQSPGGDGYGMVNVSAAGLVSLNGVLSDNTSVAPGTVGVSKNGLWPLYIPLYGRFGSLVGWIDFTNTGASLVDWTNSGVCSFAGSNVMWFRTNTDGKLYPGGFTNSLTVVGSAFSPDNTAVLLGLPGLQVILSGGNLTDALSNSVKASGSGKFTANGAEIPGLTLSLNPATGVIKGSFADPAATGATPIKGVVFQQQTNAAGFFLGPANSGSFLLTHP